MQENNSGINELYDFAIERCSFLMEDSKYRRTILMDDDRIIILAKGYFQGFYEALQMVDNQMRVTPSQGHDPSDLNN